jgi:hypothetical protein
LEKQLPPVALLATLHISDLSLLSISLNNLKVVATNNGEKSRCITGGPVVKCKQGYSLVQNGTGGLSAAFDFTTKGILQEAVKGEWWRLRDCKAKPSGVLGWWPSRAVTFIENHDTGSTQAHWPFPSDHIMEYRRTVFACY